MRVTRSQRHRFTDTSRKRAALRRRQRLEREALPPLAELVAEAQPSKVSVLEARAAQWLEHESRRLSTFSANKRAVLRNVWCRAPYPADSLSLLDFPHSYSVGRFTLDQMPFDLNMPRDPHGCRQCPLLDGGQNA